MRGSRPASSSVIATKHTRDSVSPAVSRTEARQSVVNRIEALPRIDVYTTIRESYTYMRTNIDIDDRLMRQALRSSDARTKRAVVEEALRLLIQTKGQREICRLRGKIRWEGDRGASRVERLAK